MYINGVNRHVLLISNTTIQDFTSVTVSRLPYTGIATKNLIHQNKGIYQQVATCFCH